MATDGYPWSDDEKRKYVWGGLTEAAQKNGSNIGTYIAHSVTEDDEFSPIFLSKSDQRVILQDFEAEGKIKLLPNDDPSRRGEYDFELLEPKRQRKSVYSRSISELADLVKDMGLRSRVMSIITKEFGVIDAREIKATQTVETSVHESQDELLLLMDELSLTKTDWDSLKIQTHRVIGNRYVRVFFRGDKAKRLTDAITGRSSIIKQKALEQIASMMKEWMTQQALNDFFIQLGVPTSLLLDNQASKKDLVYNVILALSSTGDESDKALLFQILEETTHPLIFGGDTERAKKAQFEISKVLRYDGLTLVGGKMRAMTDEDRALLDKYEASQKIVDPALAQTISSLFGGNPFGAVAPRPKPKPNQPVAPAQPKVEHHVHIYNDNTAVQTVQIPTPTTAPTTTREPKLKISLQDKIIEFDDNNAQIKVGEKICSLPPFKNEHFFCRAMFEVPSHEPVDWSVIAEKMTGNAKKKQSGDNEFGAKKRAIYDTMNALNQRVSEVIGTDDKLFHWDEKTVTRMF